MILAIVTNISDIQIGDKIICEYIASSGTVGTFSKLGSSTASLISATSSATPNGSFYFIMVDTDHKGRKILIADRNIQHSISWDALNTAGIASGSGLEIKYTGNILPTMTSNTAPSGFASASSVYGTTDDAWKAFDKTSTTTGTQWSTANTSSGWLSFRFTEKKVIKKYSLRGSYNTVSASPKSWTFEGSNDGGANWTVLDTQTNITNWLVSQIRSFEILNTTDYLEYRINVTENNGSSFLAISELEMMEQLSSSSSLLFTLRLPTGGISSTDKDNEWDTYIVNSTLNGTITAGDNTVWNWSGIYSWTSTVSTTASSDRSTRGNSAVNNWYNKGSNLSSAASSFGFRPVLIIEKLEEPPKSLLYHGGSYQNYKDNSWNPVSTTLPTKEVFVKEGHLISDFSRKEKVFNQTMIPNALGNGKLYKATVDLKKFIDLVKLHVK